MNTMNYYQAEIAYRREQMLRDRAAISVWRRARRNAVAPTPKKHAR